MDLNENFRTEFWPNLGVPVRVAVPPILAENGIHRTSPFPRFFRLLFFVSISFDLPKSVSLDSSVMRFPSGSTLELDRETGAWLFDNCEWRGSYESVSSSRMTERTIGNIIAVVAVFEMNWVLDIFRLFWSVFYGQYLIDILYLAIDKSQVTSINPSINFRTLVPISLRKFRATRRWRFVVSIPKATNNPPNKR